MFKRSSRLLASAVATAGLALGGLAVTAPAAHAATGTAQATYKCGNPLLGSLPLPEPLRGLLAGGFTIPATFTFENLPTVLTANVPVPAGTPISGAFNFNGGLAGVLQGIGITVQSLLGPTPLNVVGTQVNGGITTISGQLGSFTPSSQLPLPIPTSFDASTIANNPLFNALGIKCTLQPGTVFTGPGGNGGGGVVVQKQGAKVKAKAINKKGHKAVVKVKVKTSVGQKAVGDVKIKARGVKSVTKALKNGKLKVVLKGLRVGKQKIKVKFLGNGFTNAAKKKVNVKVVR